MLILSIIILTAVTALNIHYYYKTRDGIIWTVFINILLCALFMYNSLDYIISLVASISLTYLTTNKYYFSKENPLYKIGDKVFSRYMIDDEMYQYTIKKIKYSSHNNEWCYYFDEVYKGSNDELRASHYEYEKNVSDHNIKRLDNELYGDYIKRIQKIIKRNQEIKKITR